MSSPSFSLSFVKGEKVRIQTVTGETIEGVVSTFDKRMKTLVLQGNLDDRIPAQRRYDVRILKLDGIAKNEKLEGGAEKEQLVEPQTLNIQKLRAREERAVREAEREASYVGQGVSAEGQQVFDALVKTMPCAWDRDTIVVLDTVRIEKPYRLENIKGGSSSERELERIQRVLEGELKKFGSS